MEPLNNPVKSERRGGQCWCGGSKFTEDGSHLICNKCKIVWKKRIETTIEPTGESGRPASLLDAIIELGDSCVFCV